MTKNTHPTIIDQNKTEAMTASRPALTLDVERYDKMLSESDLTEKQRQEFLQTIWNIIVSFVDLGFDIHPLQQVASEDDVQGCGQKFDLTSYMAENMIPSDESLPQKQFTDAANCRETQEAKGMDS